MAEGNTVVLISGANRGLGKGLLEKFIAQPNYTVVAAKRDPNHASSKALKDMPTGSNSRLIIVKLDASVHEDAAAAVSDTKNQGIRRLDIVIANAGVCFRFPWVKDLKLEDFQGHLVPNVYGVVSLYQATRDLLNSAEKPKWITMGSSGGLIQNQHPIPNAAYAPTKLAVHWLTKRIDGEEEKIAAFVMIPGLVLTDMGSAGAEALGIPEEAAVPLEDSISGMKKVIDVASKESHGGELVGWDGQQYQW